jgi:hypothetical protein
VIDFTGNANATEYIANPSINIAYNDAVSGVDYDSLELKLDGEAIDGTTTIQTANLTEGMHILTVRVSDIAGNESKDFYDFFVDLHSITAEIRPQYGQTPLTWLVIVRLAGEDITNRVNNQWQADFLDGNVNGVVLDIEEPGAIGKHKVMANVEDPVTGKTCYASAWIKFQEVGGGPEITAVMHLPVTLKFRDRFDREVDFVRIGLWDNAFVGDHQFTTVNSGAYPDFDFIGKDSRRFYLELYNPDLNTNSNEMETVDVVWRTAFHDATDDDYPDHAEITLKETHFDTGVFKSRPLMLVTDITDYAQNTMDLQTGLEVGIAEPNHRLRMVSFDDRTNHSQVDGLIVVDYPMESGEDFGTTYATVFKRTPDERHQININFINFEDATDTASPILPTPQGVIDEQMSFIRSRYATLGIKANISYGSDHTIDLTGFTSRPTDFNLAAVMRTSDPANPSDDQQFLITSFRSIYLESPGDTLICLFIDKFVDLTRGQAFADVWVANEDWKNYIFIGGKTNAIRATGAHEIGHMLLNEDDGHYSGMHYDQNLMVGGTTSSSPAKCTDSKRWWGESSGQIKQIFRDVEPSRFIKPF